MLIAFIALSLIPVAIVGILGIVSNVNSLRKISINNLKYDLAETQKRLDLFFRTIEENVYFLTSSGSFDRFVEAINSRDTLKIDVAIFDLMPEIMSFTHNRNYFYQIKFIDRYGDEQFIVENVNENYKWLKRSELNRSGTRFYLYIANNILPNTASFLPVELKENNLNKLIPAVSCIYHVRKPNFFGVLVFHIYAEDFFELVNHENIINPSAKVMLVNKEGYYLFHSEKKTDWNQLSASKQTMNLRKDFGNELADKILSNTADSIYELADNIIVQTKVFSSDFGLDNQYTLLLSVLKKDIFKTTNSYKLFFLIVLLFFFIFSSLLALFATNQFIGPISKLIIKARIISTGNYGARVNVNTNDEIEELADQFNIMASSLQQREIEIIQHKNFMEQKVKDRTRDLENEKNKLNTIFNNVPIGFLLLDMKYNIISASVAIEKIFGKQIKEIIGKNYIEIIDWQNDNKEKLIEKIKNTGVTLSDYTSFLKKDGSKQFLEHILVPIRKNSRIESVLEIIIDITERKRLQDSIVQSERLAATGELAAVIAHEMRNSLTSVRMILQLLSRKEGYSKSDADSFEVALDSVDRMERIVNDLLQLAKPSTLQRKPERLNEIIEYGVEFYNSHLQQKDLKLKIELEYNLPKLMLDKNRIKEVIINLFLNAVQAIEGKGNIFVSTKAISLTKVLRDTAKITIDDSDYSKFKMQEIILKKGANVVQFEIGDDGSGIHSGNIDRIFDPFFTTKANGTGLGLSLVKSIINQHGGIIKVHSQVGMGTKFIIYLPL